MQVQTEQQQQQTFASNHSKDDDQKNNSKAALSSSRPCSTYLRVSGALVGFLETSSFLVDKLLQLLLGKVIQFHGEREGLLCYRLQKKHIVKSNFLKNSVLRSAVYQSSCRPSSAAQYEKQFYIKPAVKRL